MKPICNKFSMNQNKYFLLVEIKISLIFNLIYIYFFYFLKKYCLKCLSLLCIFFSETWNWRGVMRLYEINKGEPKKLEKQQQYKRNNIQHFKTELSLNSM